MKRYYNFIILMLVVVGCGPSPEEQKMRTEQSIDRGQQLYLGNGCAVCHGKEGRGDGLSAKNYYPPPIDFHDPKAYRIGSSVNDIRNTIKKGITTPGSGMPAYDHLTDQELNDLAQFLKSLQIE